MCSIDVDISKIRILSAMLNTDANVAVSFDVRIALCHAGWAKGQRPVKHHVNQRRDEVTPLPGANQVLAKQRHFSCVEVDNRAVQVVTRPNDGSQKEHTLVQRAAVKRRVHQGIRNQQRE